MTMQFHLFDRTAAVMAMPDGPRFHASHGVCAAALRVLIAIAGAA